MHCSSTRTKLNHKAILPNEKWTLLVRNTVRMTVLDILTMAETNLT